MSVQMNDTFAILIDTTRCKGCEKCVAACKEENGLGDDRPWRGQGAIDGLSPTRNCTVLRQADDRFVLQQCRHCLEPACVSACLVGAMQKTPEGPVIYDADKCMGCRYCLMACPYGIPRYDWDRAAPEVHKCTMCYDRVSEGREPACVEACPEEATVFGTRAELLAEARRRMAAEPGKYVPVIFGEHEVGGTSVLYISDAPLAMGWKADLGDQPLPALTWASLEKVPPVVVGMGTLMAGIYWVIGRRMKLAAEANVALAIEAAAAESGPAGEEADHD
ncbi:MAG TPA: 4Fe-4S dicluster domain-containing protein [Longimicrobiales bacterium]|jgi:formate dehydrogenase iron-sulfur subunit